jgi:hypothetical protein
MKNPDKKGGKGMHPLGCLPYWGRVEVTLLTAAENKRIPQKKRISTKPFFGSFLLSKRSISYVNAGTVNTIFRDYLHYRKNCYERKAFLKIFWKNSIIKICFYAMPALSYSRQTYRAMNRAQGAMRQR